VLSGIVSSNIYISTEKPGYRTGRKYCRRGSLNSMLSEARHEW